MGRRFVPQSTILRRMQRLDDRFAADLMARFPEFRPRVAPVVEVLLVPDPQDTTGAVVTVRLVPVPGSGR